VVPYYHCLTRKSLHESNHESQSYYFSVVLDRTTMRPISLRLSVSIVLLVTGAILWALAVELTLLTSGPLIIDDFWLFGAVFLLLGGVLWVIATRR
jgi:hypothetical protein